MSDTSERDCLLQPRGQRPPTPLPPLCRSSHSQEGAGMEAGHLFSSPFPTLWFFFNVGAPAPLCSSPLSPGNVSILKASRCSPLLTTVVPAQTHTASKQPTGQMPRCPGVPKPHIGQVSFRVPSPACTRLGEEHGPGLTSSQWRQEGGGLQSFLSGQLPLRCSWLRGLPLCLLTQGTGSPWDLPCAAA